MLSCSLHYVLVPSEILVVAWLHDVLFKRADSIEISPPPHASFPWDGNSSGKLKVGGGEAEATADGTERIR